MAQKKIVAHPFSLNEGHRPADKLPPLHDMTNTRLGQRLIDGLPAESENARVYRLGRCTALVARERGQWHLSISHPSRYPTWDEIAKARYGALPHDVMFAMLLPPPEEYVNLHSNTFHLYELTTRDEPV